MTQMLFLPNEHMLLWLEPVPGVPAAELAERVRRGEWRLPEAVRAALDRHLLLPDRLELTASAHDRLVVIRPLRAALQARPPGGLDAENAPPDAQLSQRQREIMRRMADGQTTSAICHALDIHRRTLQNEVKVIKLALGVKTRAQAVAKGGTESGGAESGGAQNGGDAG